MGRPPGHLPRRPTLKKCYAAKDTHWLDVFTAAFRHATCRVCPAHTKCTRSRTQGRHLQIRPRLQHEAIRRVRQAQTTAAFAQQYARRLGIKATLSQAVRAFGLRRSRYLGLAKTHLQRVATAAAINLERFADHLRGARLIAFRQTPFAALAVA